MNFLDALGTFLIAAVLLAGLAVAVKPGSQAGNIISAFFTGSSGLISAAKG